MGALFGENTVMGALLGEQTGESPWNATADSTARPIMPQRSRRSLKTSLDFVVSSWLNS